MCVCVLCGCVGGFGFCVVVLGFLVFVWLCWGSGFCFGVRSLWGLLVVKRFIPYWEANSELTSWHDCPDV